MRSRIFKSALLLGALNLGVMAHAQSVPKIQWDSADVAVTYGMSIVKPVQSNQNSWIPGAGINGSIAFYHGLGAAASFVGEHTSNITAGVGITKLSYMGGPRYTYVLKTDDNKHRTSIFGEGLFGGTYAYDSIFPAADGAKVRTNVFTMQVGGGLDMEIGKRFGIRLPEIHYVQSHLPNAGSNTQNDVRLAAGVSYHFQKR